MGLTIFYSGRLASIKLLPVLIEEVSEICFAKGWRVDFHFSTPDIPVSGISFTPEGGETIWLTFLKDGTLINEAHYLIREQLPSMEFPEEAKPCLPAVTQFAGIETHIEILRLLRYVSQKYFAVFDVIDESEYWETDDEKICRKNFDLFEKWMNELAQALDKLDGRIGETGETVNERIQDLVMNGTELEEIFKVMDECDDSYIVRKAPWIKEDRD